MLFRSVFTYEVCFTVNSVEYCDQATVTIVVGPDAVDDLVTTPFETPVNGDVRTNDTYPVGSTFDNTSDPANGTLVFNADGTFLFTPDPDFTGIVTFSYEVCFNPCDEAVVTIVVGPQANDDDYSAPFNTPVTSNVNVNDIYPVNSTFNQLTSPLNGSVVFASNGSFNYTPAPGFSGVDMFTYEVCLASPYGSMCDVATVTIVTGPEAVNDYLTSEYNSPVLGDISDNDTYPPGSVFLLIDPPLSGTLDLDPDGDFTFTPAPGFTGEVTFTYEVCFEYDGDDYCEEATVTINVLCPEFETWIAVLQECAVSEGGNPTALFTLTEADAMVTTGNPSGIVPAGVTVTYHDSYTDAQAGINALSSPYESTTADVWARVEEGGCYAIDIVQLVVYTPGVINLTKTDVTCNGANDGTILINMQGAPAPFNIEWEDDALIEVSIPNSYVYYWENLTPGTYTATITDGNGCVLVRSVTITEPPLLTATATDRKSVV